MPSLVLNFLTVLMNDNIGCDFSLPCTSNVKSNLPHCHSCLSKFYCMTFTVIGRSLIFCVFGILLFDLWLWILLKWRMHVFYILALQMSESNFVTKRLNTFKWLALIYWGFRLKKVKGEVNHIPVLFMILIAFISSYSCCSVSL